MGLNLNILEVHESASIWPHGKDSAKRCTCEDANGTTYESNIRNEDLAISQILIQMLKDGADEALVAKLSNAIEEYGSANYRDGADSYSGDER